MGLSQRPDAIVDGELVRKVKVTTAGGTAEGGLQSARAKGNVLL